MIPVLECCPPANLFILAKCSLVVRSQFHADVMSHSKIACLLPTFMFTDLYDAILQGMWVRGIVGGSEGGGGGRGRRFFRLILIITVDLQLYPLLRTRFGCTTISSAVLRLYLSQDPFPSPLALPKVYITITPPLLSPSFLPPSFLPKKNRFFHSNHWWWW